MKHTKGPWRIAPTKAREIISPIGIVAIPQGTEQDIAAISPLIAAAPELLDILKSCKVLMEGLPYDGPEQLKLLEDTIKLIAKAEGRE